MIVTAVGLLVAGGLIGFWLFWQFWMSRYPNPALMTSHAVLGWVGVLALGVVFSLGHTWEVTLYQEGTMAGFLLAGLFGILQGLIRLARRGSSTSLIVVHVVCAFLGFGFLAFVLF